MKYGETLRQRSIPAWSGYNIDYDDIKHFIKEQTTPGKGKTVAIPGRGVDKSQAFEDNLFHILEEQHERIDLFVKSKAREIQHRLNDARKRLRQLSRRNQAADSRIPVSRLERYGRLENDVLKAGDEIRSLARFTSTQRTAFRKLLKKYKKWTSSSQLEQRFREEVLDEPKSFTKYDLGPLLDEYSEILQRIRTLYESKLQQEAVQRFTPSAATSSVGSSIIARLQAGLATGSKGEFDTAIATVPQGEPSTFASYFVHSDSLVELQVLLLQHLRYYAAKSRTNSIVGTHSPVANGDCPTHGHSENADYYMLAVDNAERLAKEQSALTVNDREHANGVTPQRPSICARWNDEEEAIVTAKTNSSNVRVAALKKKRVDAYFDRAATFANKQESSALSESNEDLMAIRNEYLKDSGSRPLYRISCNRSRMTGLKNGGQTCTVATLDTNISSQDPTVGAVPSSKANFPHALLMVRQEGTTASELFTALDNSHLVERVRGFSMQYHALWQACKSAKVSEPFWTPILSRDIRKLPPPAMKRGSLADGGSGSQSVTQASTSTASIVGATDSTTAVETDQPSRQVTEQMEAPPLRSFRKKRRRTNFEESTQPQQRYWSEYDHPEELGGDDANAYVIYIDPNEKSTLDRLFERFGRVLGRRKPEREALLESSLPSPGDETSSDEETVKPQDRSYGSIARRSFSGRSHAVRFECRKRFLPQLTTICLVASLIILVMAYIMAMTGRHKYATQVDAGVIFAVVSSLLFAVVGFASLLRLSDVAWQSWTVAVTVLIVDAVGSGGLLAWILG